MNRLIFLVILIFPFSSCIELLEFSAEDVAGLGVEIDGLGELSIADEGLFNSSWKSVRLSETNELFVRENGEVMNFGELVDENSIKLKSDRTVSLPGNVYKVSSEQAYIRYNPYLDINNQNIIGTFEKGRLVIVSSESFGWYEVQLPDHLVGYVLASSLIPISENKKKKNPFELKNRIEWRNNVNYIINRSFANNPISKELIVNFVNEDGCFDKSSSQYVCNVMKKQGYICTDSFFSKNYYSDGIYLGFFNNYSYYTKKLNLYKNADYLLICIYNITYHTNEIKKDMITSELEFKIRKINLQSNTIESSIDYTINGNGWSSNESKQDVLISLYKIVEKNIK